jgi:hypothetical protein
MDGQNEISWGTRMRQTRGFCRYIYGTIWFHRLQQSLPCNDHRLHKEPMSDSYGMKTAVFAYHPLKTTLLNYLLSTHLDNIYSF